MEMVRVESTDSPLSAMAGVKTPPQGTGVCILACEVSFVAFLHSEGGSEVSCTRTRQVPSQEGVCISAVAAVVHIVYLLLHMQQDTERSV